MKIQQVHIKKFKAIEDLDETINGNNIFVMGDNGVGKSSFIQFIEIALGNTNNIPPNADGSGYVVTDKDGKQITFSVKFKDGKPVVTVETDGLKDNRKSALAGIVGAMDFDIDQFVEMSKTKKGQKDQVEIFKSFLAPEVIEDINKFEVHVKTLFDERTELGRHIKETAAIINSHPLRNEMNLDAFKPVDTGALMAQLSEAQKANNNISDIKHRFEARATEIEAIKKQIYELTVKAEQLEAQQKGASKFLAENSPINTEAIEQQISQASETNAKAAAAEVLKEKRKLLEKMTSENEDMTVRIETERQAIKDAIRDMESPVEGLSFDEDTLLYKGIPVSPDSLSTSEIMELGVKLKMAENPNLGVLFLQRGESLGAKRLKEIVELCDKNGWQVIMEQVERGTEKLKFEIINLD